ncbi:MAG: class I SAM-dependent methyltransferase [Acidobacteria bacterium]|nr:class I SAM-dependent methyltransferase [Acidobacteriota bacterium]
MLGPLKDLFRGGRGGPQGYTPAPPPGAARPGSAFSNGSANIETRPSRGLEAFFGQIRDQVGLTILDLGGASQKNITFITELGHRLYSEDFLAILRETFGEDDPEQSNPGRIDYFLKQTLDYPEGHFDGVLIWDVLEYLSPVLLNAVIERLHHVVSPRSYMLAVFHSDDKLQGVPNYSFRIADLGTLEIAQHGQRKPAQLFNNRSLEKLFGNFDSVKFFLTRERLREVIIKA